jgi:glycosyltransferase involved in cell wall biosynthesis
MQISIIQPSRNNLKYLKWSYQAIRKNQGDHVVEICVADDFSDKDNTWEWCQEMMAKDPHFKAIRNEGPDRLGHTILYDRLVNEVASHDICMIYHADMYLCPGALDVIEKYIAPKQIVSLTRIEPPLHPPGPEKILRDFGTEPESFREEELLADIPNHALYIKSKVTEGIFAPWAFMKADFQEIGGHDPLYAPQSKEDSDIFNRFQLNGVKFVQTWEGFVYHMTCRGSRFNPILTTPGQNSAEWEQQNIRSTRNFIRKWGHFVRHDEYLKPIIPPKYNIVFKITNCDSACLFHLEPWCSTLYCDIPQWAIDSYIRDEQENTQFNLADRIKTIPSDIKLNAGIVVSFDAAIFSWQHDFVYIQQLTEIIENSILVSDSIAGTFQIGNLQLDIYDVLTYEKENIFL